MENSNTKTQRFAPKKNILAPSFFILVQFFILAGQIIIFQPKTFPTAAILLVLGFTLLTFGYYLWQWFGTYYELRNGELFYRSGFTKGSTPVSSIREIETHTRSWANINASIAWKGMMITYNKWDELFIAPKDEAGFLEVLLQINPEIEVKQHGKPEQLASK